MGGGIDDPGQLMGTPDSAIERYQSFQDVAVRSSKGSSYDEYFGHLESLDSSNKNAKVAVELSVSVRSVHRPWWKFWAR